MMYACLYERAADWEYGHVKCMKDETLEVKEYEMFAEACCLRTSRND